MSGLPERLRGLLQPRSYSHPVQSVELVQTHISWVLLTGTWAYKIKRPVRYPFVDLRSLERRTFLCHEEVRLNRRFAPDLYDSVCPITIANGEARMEGGGAAIEHAVKMRQFRRDEELDRLVDAGLIEPQALEEFGRDLARIHLQLPSAAPDHKWGEPGSIRTAVLENHAQCTRAAKVFGGAADVAALRAPLAARLDALASLMSTRHAGNRVKECHADLHCSNIVRRGAGLIAFDCLEFEPAFRWIDVADEIALLLADLHSRQRPQHALAFLNGYLAQGGDYQACRLLDLYQTHRSLVRAKIMALEGGAAARAGTDAAGKRRRFAQWMSSAGVSLSAKRPVLILMSGLSGSGKTWLAQRLAPHLGAIHLRSDVERRRLAGIAAEVRSHSALQEGMYSPGVSARVNEHLAMCAADTLAGGYTTIVDATFIRRQERTHFRHFAANLGIRVCLVQCRAPKKVLRARVKERHRDGRDPSEADLSVLAWQEQHAELVTAEESMVVFEATTAAPDPLEELAARIADWIKKGGGNPVTAAP